MTRPGVVSPVPVAEIRIDGSLLRLRCGVNRRARRASLEAR